MSFYHWKNSFDLVNYWKIWHHFNTSFSVKIIRIMRSRFNISFHIPRTFRMSELLYYSLWFNPGQDFFKFAVAIFICMTGYC